MARKGELVHRAGADQIEHTHRHGDTRTLCGLRIVEERKAWPRMIQCPECVAAEAPISNRR